MKLPRFRAQLWFLLVSILAIGLAVAQLGAPGPHAGELAPVPRRVDVEATAVTGDKSVPPAETRFDSTELPDPPNRPGLPRDAV